MNDNKKPANFTEAWSRWTPPIIGKDGDYDIIKIEDNIENLKIFLRHMKINREIEICFDGGVLAYRTTDESFRINLIHELTQKYGKSFYVDWSFFKVEESNYLKWLVDEAFRTVSESKVNHFSIMGPDLIVDILAFDESEIMAY